MRCCEGSSNLFSTPSSELFKKRYCRVSYGLLHACHGQLEEQDGPHSRFVGMRFAPIRRHRHTDSKQTKIHKKYLGETDDLHFIPDSPLIDRQTLSAFEEGELKRTCALALARVPHSDDMSDDPFQYIAPQIHTKPPPSVRPQTLPASVPDVPAIPLGTDTATPSDGSKRDTMDRVDYSTPMTSAGITPGETTKRFSDAARRASSSKGSSNLKYETAQSNKSRAVSASHPVLRKSNDPGMRKSQEARKHSADHRSSDRTLRLVRDDSTQPRDLPRPALYIRPERYSQLELNKQLPPVPQSDTEPSSQTAIAWMMKTIKQKKSQVFDGRNSSTSVPSTPLPTTKPETPRLRHKSMPVAPPVPAVPATESKRKFKLPFFSNRKQRPQQGVIA